MHVCVKVEVSGKDHSLDLNHINILCEMCNGNHMGLSMHSTHG